MGRVKSKYPKGNFVFKSSKPNAKGERALYLQYIVNTIPVFITTGIFIKDADWDNKTQTVKSKKKKPPPPPRRKKSVEAATGKGG